MQTISNLYRLIDRPYFLKKIIVLSIIFLFISSCTPRILIVEYPGLVSKFYVKKISTLESKELLTIEEKRTLIKTKIEYGYGVLLEQSDRLLDQDYQLGLEKANDAYKQFNEARDVCISIINNSYPNFNKWLDNKADINFNKDDVYDLYWLAASYGGALRASRGKPYELVNLYKIGHLLEKAIDLDSKWGRGALFSAMMSYTSARPDLFGQNHIDSVTYYFDKAIVESDSLDAGVFVSYAELIDKKFQRKASFEKKLKYVLNMNINEDRYFRLTNIIAQERAKWLLSKKSDYFLE